MPEYDQKERKISGEEIVTSSSNQAIEATLAGLIREIKGLPQTDVVVEGDSLNPIINLAPDEKKEFRGEPTNVIPISTRISHKDSATGHSLVKQRSFKKAA
jgi:hypothetical protein